MDQANQVHVARGQPAQQAAQAAHTALFGADHGVSDAVLADVGGQLVGSVLVLTYALVVFHRLGPA